MMVAIIVPVHNGEKYLKKCIDSLLAQTFNNISIIIIDDCSTDRTEEITQRYVRQYPDRIRVIRNKINLGVDKSRFCGIEEALKDIKIEYVTFVDADDWLEKDIITFQVKLAKEHKADVVECRYIREYAYRVAKSRITPP